MTKEQGKVRTLLDDVWTWATLSVMALATAAYVVCVALPMRVWRWIADRTWPM